MGDNTTGWSLGRYLRCKESLGRYLKCKESLGRYLRCKESLGVFGALFEQVRCQKIP